MNAKWRFHIQGHENRKHVVEAFANEGYPVWVEKVKSKRPPYEEKWFVCIKEKP